MEKIVTVIPATKPFPKIERVPQYYVRNSHPAIIPPDEFDAVQVETQRRSKLGRPSACQSPLSMKLVCADCGGFFGSKVWNSTSKYRRVIWQCNDKYKAEKKCATPHVTEDEVRQKFVEAFNLLSEFSEELITNCRLAQFTLCDCADIDTQLDESRGELEVVTELARKAIYENAHGTLKDDDWKQRDAGYQERHQKAVDRMARLESIKSGKQHKSMVLESFIRNLEETESTIDEFNEKLWMMVIERVVVSSNGELTFRFKDGTEISR